MKWVKSIFLFYKDGFSHLKLGKTLWKIIIVKLLVMVFILKLLFFSETLNTQFQTDIQKSDFVLNNLTKETK